MTTAKQAIRGSIISPARDWIKKHYGEKAFHDATAKLSPDDRAFVEGVLLSSTLYSVKSWNAFLRAMEVTVAAEYNESAEVFCRRVVRGAVSGAVQTVLKLFLGIFQPTSIFQRFPIMANRFYEGLECKILENITGRFSVVIRGTGKDTRDNVAFAFLETTIFLGEMSKAKNVQGKYSKNSIAADESFEIEVTLTYDA